MIVAVDGAGYFFGALAKLRIFFRAAEAVGFIVWLRAVVAIEAHGAIAIVSVDWALRLVDGETIVVDAQAITMRVRIRNQTGLQHFVWREAHAGDDVARL